MDKILKNTREVAKYFGVTTMTIYRWINIKGMPYIELANGRRGYDIEAIEKWLLGKN